MKKLDIALLTAGCAACLVGIVGRGCAKAASETQDAPKAVATQTTTTESVYTHFDSIRDSMWQNHAANMTGFHNELIWKYDSINESKAPSAKKNAAIAKAVEEYKQKCEAFHTDFVNKFSDLYDKQCDSIAAVQNKAKTLSR